MNNRSLFLVLLVSIYYFIKVAFKLTVLALTLIKDTVAAIEQTFKNRR